MKAALGHKTEYLALPEVSKNIIDWLRTKLMQLFTWNFGIMELDFTFLKM